MIKLDVSTIIIFMVNNVEKLTRSVREGFEKREPATRDSSAVIAAQRVRQQLHQTGKAIFVDDKGNRFLIERRPA